MFPVAGVSPIYLSDLLLPYSAPHELRSRNKRLLAVMSTNRFWENQCFASHVTHIF